MQKIELTRTQIEQDVNKIIDKIALPFDPFKENGLIPQVMINASDVIKTMKTDTYEEIIKSYCKSNKIEIEIEYSPCIGANIVRYFQEI